MKADTSVIKGDDFDFWSYREKIEQERQDNFEKEKQTLMEKYTAMTEENGFDHNLRSILDVPTFRETVGKICTDFDSFSPLHFQALAERESMRGEHLNVRTVHLMMLAADINLNEQDYTILFRSYWKDGTVAHLVSVLKEMNLFGLNPTPSMIKIASQAAKAAKDTNAEKQIKSISTSLSEPSDLSLQDKTNREYRRMLSKTDFIRELLDTETPPGDFFLSLFGTHENFS